MSTKPSDHTFPGASAERGPWLKRPADSRCSLLVCVDGDSVDVGGSNGNSYRHELNGIKSWILKDALYTENSKNFIEDT